MVYKPGMYLNKVARRELISKRESFGAIAEGLAGIIIGVGALSMIPEKAYASDFEDQKYSHYQGTIRRERWYNFFEAGQEALEKKDYEISIDFFSEALKQRDTDQSRARTYGMHFVDYFPKRGIGIAHFELGNVDMAIKFLKESIKDEESNLAIEYLQKARGG